MPGSAGLTIKPDCLRGLFQPQQLCDYSSSLNPLETSQLNSVQAFPPVLQNYTLRRHWVS